MPTGTKLETALASAKGLAADMKTFSLDTDNQEAKQMFNQLATTMDGVEQSLQSRLDFVKQQEQGCWIDIHTYYNMQSRQHCVISSRSGYSFGHSTCCNIVSLRSQW